MELNLTEGTFHFSIGGFTFLICTLLIILLIRKIVRMVRPESPEVSDEDDEELSKADMVKNFAGKFVGSKKQHRYSYRKVDAAIAKMEEENIVVIFDVKGPILTDRRSVPAFMRMHATFGSELGTTLKRLSKNEKVKAVLLRLNTPGGTPTGSEDICSGLVSFREAGKATLAYVSDMSASGGVMAMVGAEEIFLHPNAIIGSVGVIGPRLMHFNKVTGLGGGLFGESVRADRVEAQRIHAGKGKALGDPFLPQEPDAVASLQRMVERVYERFLVHIEKHARIPKETMREKGAVLFDVSEAIALGLGNKEGDLEAAQARIAEKLGAEKWENCTPVHVGLSGRDRFSFAVWLEPFVDWFCAHIMVSYLRTQPVLCIWPQWWGVR